MRPCGKRYQGRVRPAAIVCRRLVPWLAALLIAADFGLRPHAAAASEVEFDLPVPLSRCLALRGADLPAALRRSGVFARRCFVRPALNFFVLSSDPTSWPAVQERGGRIVSLEDPVAKRLWVDDAGPVGVSFRTAELVVGRDARNRPKVAYYSGLADRLDGTGSIDVFVVIRIRPHACLLGVVADEAEARRMAADEGSTCRPTVDGG